MILIGSRAAPFLNRNPKDWDYISTQTEYEDFLKSLNVVDILPKKYSYNVFAQGYQPIEVEIVEKRPSTKLLGNYLNYKIAPLNLLYALKMSHRFLKNSPHFLKTRKDILKMRELNAIIPDDLKEWHKARQKETYDYSHPSLNKSKNDFFVDEFYVYDHDTIHEAVKVFHTPAYNFIKEDTAEVKCSKEKFNNLHENIRLATVYEEAAVLALERHQIPNKFKPNPSKSFSIAMMKVCTSITSGWWRDFAWESYDKVMEFYRKIGETKYVEDFHQAKEKGVIKPFTGNLYPMKKD